MFSGQQQMKRFLCSRNVCSACAKQVKFFVMYGFNYKFLQDDY